MACARADQYGRDDRGAIPSRECRGMNNDASVWQQLIAGAASGHSPSGIALPCAALVIIKSGPA